MRRLYLATPPQVLDDGLERQFRFVTPVLDCEDVRRVLCQAETHGLVHEIRDGTVRLHSLDPKGAVECRIEVHGRRLGPCPALAAPST